MPDVDAFLAAKRQRLDLAEARLGPALADLAVSVLEPITRRMNELMGDPAEIEATRAAMQAAGVTVS